MIKYSMIRKKNGVIIKMVNLFFKVNNKFLIHKCENEVAEKYGDFLNFPESHMEIWEKFYAKKYHVDFDYFPRGRVVYNINEKCYYIYHDKCITNLEEILKEYENEKYKICTDYHYQCRKCNKNYII